MKTFREFKTDIESLDESKKQQIQIKKQQVQITKREYDKLYKQHKDNYATYQKTLKYPSRMSANPPFHVQQNSDGSISTQTRTGSNIGTPKHDAPTIMHTTDGEKRPVYHKFVKSIYESEENQDMGD